jgi:copper chaperone CopZ
MPGSGTNSNNQELKINNLEMKKIVFVFIALLLGAGMTTAQDQEKTKKTEEIVIHTSAVCGMCKERIEHDLAFEKGVKGVELDNETKDVTVQYNPKKTDADKIRIAISKIGYDADDVEAEPKAYAKLPACCKKDVAPH